MTLVKSGSAKAFPLDKKQGLTFQPLCDILNTSNREVNEMEVNVKCQDCVNWYKTNKTDHCKNCPLKNKKN